MVTEDDPSQTAETYKEIHIRCDIFDRWQKVGAAERLLTDSQIAGLLIQQYETRLGDRSVPACVLCQSSLPWVCPKCQPPSSQDSQDTADTKTQESSKCRSETTVTQPKRGQKPGKEEEAKQKSRKSKRPRKCKGRKRYDTDDSDGELPLMFVQDLSDDPEVKHTEVAKSSKKQSDSSVSPVVNCAKESERSYEGNTINPLAHATTSTVNSTSGCMLKGVNEGKLSSEQRCLQENNHDKVRQASQTNRKSAPLVQKTYPCPDCLMSFGNDQGLLHHMRKKHGVKKPNLADLDLDDSSDGTTNKKKAPGFVCTKCGAFFSGRFHLAIHMRKHTGERPFPCSECSKSFKCKAHLESHMRCHTGALPYRCKHCEKAFRQTSQLKVHMKKFHPQELKSASEKSNKEKVQKTYPCSECGKIFYVRRNLTVHLRVHTNERPYACTLCSSSFKVQHALVYHMRTHTGERPFKCRLCDKAFSQAGFLKAHLRTHTGETPFICPHCGQGFAQQGGLKVHIRRLHTKEKSHTCPVCGAGFASSSEVTSHLLVHTDAKPYQCEHCPAAFKTPNNLKLHMQMHGGPKLERKICKVCGTSISGRGNMKAHMRIHNDERPYKCELCVKAFKHKGSLNVHMLSHTDERPHVCDVCGVSYRAAHCLRSHKAKKHTGLPNSLEDTGTGGSVQKGVNPLVYAATGAVHSTDGYVHKEINVYQPALSIAVDYSIHADVSWVSAHQ